MKLSKFVESAQKTVDSFSGHRVLCQQLESPSYVFAADNNNNSHLRVVSRLR